MVGMKRMGKVHMMEGIKRMGEGRGKEYRGSRKL